MPEFSRYSGGEHAGERTTLKEIERLLAGKHRLDSITSGILQDLQKAKSLAVAEWKKLGSELYEKRLCEYLEDVHLTEQERKFLDDLAKVFRLSHGEALEIRRAHGSETIKKLLQLALDDQSLSPEEKTDLFQLGDYMGLTAEFVETFLAGQSKLRER